MAKKVIRLNESELTDLVKKVINEMYECNNESAVFDNEEDDDDLLNYVTKYSDEVLDDLEEYEPEETPSESEEEEDDEYVSDEEGMEVDDLDAFEDKPEEDEPKDKKKYLHGKFDPSDWFNKAEPEAEEQHEDGDIVYHENIPIEKKDGRYHMTIEDGFKMDNGGCPRIDVVSDSLNKVKAEYDRLWNSYYYKDHGKYAEDMINKGKGQLQVDDQQELDNGVRFEDFPVYIDLDK